MEKIVFAPTSDTNAQVVGYLHTPITEMPIHRELFPAVVVCPGGAYEMVSEREADPIAIAFFAAGYNVFTLTYSVMEQASGYRPLREVSETVRAVREHREWRVDPEKIAVCGFSAGGHLAGSLGTMWNDPEFYKHYEHQNGENKPNAMILSYPVITADEYAHTASIFHVSGCNPGTPGYEYFDLTRHVSRDTCPAFLWHTAEDDCVPVENSLLMMLALQREKIPFEAHIFPYGGHGTSACTEEVGCKNDYNARWLPAAITWLNHEFDFTL